VAQAGAGAEEGCEKQGISVGSLPSRFDSFRLEIMMLFSN
jgi:hypothetical protein